MTGEAFEGLDIGVYWLLVSIVEGIDMMIMLETNE